MKLDSLDGGGPEPGLLEELLDVLHALPLRLRDDFVEEEEAQRRDPRVQEERPSTLPSPVTGDRVGE